MPDGATVKVVPWTTRMFLSNCCIRPGTGKQHGLLSSMFFSYATELLAKAQLQPPSEQDLLSLPVEAEAAEAGRRLREHLQTMSLKAACWRTVRKGFLISCSLKAVWLIASVVNSAIVLRALIQQLGQLHDQEAVLHGIGLAVAFGAAEAIRSFAVNGMWMAAVSSGLGLRAALRAAIFENTLHMPAAQVGEQGKLVNLALQDSGRLLEAANYATFLVSTPVTLVVVLGMLSWRLGWEAGLSGVATLVVSAFITSRIGKMQGQIRRAVSSKADDRLSTLSEVLQGIRHLKLAAYEDQIAQGIESIRRQELRGLRRSAILRVINGAIAFSAPAVVVLVAFAVVTAIGGTLSASDAFAVIGLFNSARFPLGVFPQSVRVFSEGLVSISRIEQLLRKPQLSPEDAPARQQGEAAVAVECISATWKHRPIRSGKPEAAKSAPAKAEQVEIKTESSSSEGEPTVNGIRDVSFKLLAGQVCGISGPVRAGKSSLLMAMLGELTRVEGSIRISTRDPRIAYCGQSPWIICTSVRNNIILGSGYDEARYNAVISACQLDNDLLAFPNGSDTQVGERGITLSGGQMARIALARAAYCQASLYLLDGVLEALDSRVAAAVFSQCIMGLLRKQGATVLLVTHNRGQLQQCDVVMKMEHGTVSAFGAPAHVGIEAALSSDTGTVAGMLDDAAASTPAKAVSTTTAASTAVASVPGKKGPGSGKLIAAEDRETGTLSRQVLVKYARAAGSAWLIAVLALALMMSRGARQGSDYVIARWTGRSADVGSLDAGPLTPLAVYALTVAAVTVTTIIQGAIFAMVFVRASGRVHATALSSLLHARISWFDTQPVGRILSRFSGDVEVLDSGAPALIETAAENSAQILLSLVTVMAVLPYYLILAAFLFVVFSRLTRIFRSASRDLKRIDGITRSPVASLLTDVVHGVTSIRAFGLADQMRQRNFDAVDLNSRSYFSLYVSNRWLAIRLDSLTTVSAGVSAVLCVLLRVPPSIGGLALTAALSLGGILQYTFRTIAEAESALTSVERLDAMSRVPSEPQLQGEPVTAEEAERALGPVPPVVVAHKAPHAVPASWNAELAARSWPTAGVLEVRGVTARYRDGLPAVLRDVSFVTRPAERVCVVGRTGAGKSTVCAALLRALEYEGSILLDGVDLKRVPLAQVRRNISLIPQDFASILVKGSLRKNLDPFGEADEADILRVLEVVGLTQWLQSLSAGLEHQLASGGAGLSTGTRQQLALARALLRKAKLVLADEPVAQLDPHTDALIQTAMKHALQGSTVLTIAHRLQTAVEADRVLVLDAGTVVAFDTPARLLGIESGPPADVGAWLATAPPNPFAQLIAATGPAECARLLSCCVV